MNNEQIKKQIRNNYDFELGMLGYFERLKDIDPIEIPIRLKGVDHGFIEAINDISEAKFETEIDRVIQFLHSVKFYLKTHNFLIDKLHKAGGVVEGYDYDAIIFKGE